MASIQKYVRRFSKGTAALGTDVTASNAFATAPTKAHRQYLAPVNTTKLLLNDLVFAVDTLSGGKADGVGQKVMSFPEGGIVILGARVAGTATTAAGLSAANAVLSLGTVIAADASAVLTATGQNDILASGNLNSAGTSLTAATDHAIKAVGAPASNNLVLDGTATAKDVFLNVAGTFTHASGGKQNLTLKNVEIEILWSYIGDN